MARKTYVVQMEHPEIESCWVDQQQVADTTTGDKWIRDHGLADEVYRTASYVRAVKPMPKTVRTLVEVKHA